MEMNEKVKNLSKKLASAMIANDSDEWPPDCIIFTYQPIRPKKEDQVVETLDESQA